MKTKQTKTETEHKFLRSQFVTFRKGFTLIETLVALAIFSAAVVALITVTGSGVANTNFAKNKITASYLAQEGIELARNIRDSAVIADLQNGWQTFLSTVLACNPKTSGNPGCSIDPINLVISSCQNLDGCLLYYVNYNNADGFYRTIGNLDEKSIFSRLIVVDSSFSGGAEAKITSMVSWQQGGTTRRVSVSENLFNWQAPPTGGGLSPE